MCFFLDRRIEEMTILKVEFELPGATGVRRPFAGRGVVVRCQALSPHLDHYEIAVFFDEVGAASRSALEAFLTEHAG